MSYAYSFETLSLHWRDEPAFHEQVIIDYDNAVIAVPKLAEHRKWVEENKFGFGHRAFHRVWHLLAKELPDGFKFLEIGVHMGQSLSAVDLAAEIENKTCTVVGVSPFDGAGGFYERRDFRPDVDKIFETWNGTRRPVLIKGFSQDEHVKTAVGSYGLFDALYIDGDHSFDSTWHDLMHYSPLVKTGGYLITDDSATSLNLFGWAFKGFQGSSDACDKLLPPKTPNANWKHIGNVMHLRIWQKK